MAAITDSLKAIRQRNLVAKQCVKFSAYAERYARKYGLEAPQTKVAIAKSAEARAMLVALDSRAS